MLGDANPLGGLSGGGLFASAVHSLSRDPSVVAALSPFSQVALSAAKAGFEQLVGPLEQMTEQEVSEVSDEAGDAVTSALDDVSDIAGNVPILGIAIGFVRFLVDAFQGPTAQQQAQAAAAAAQFCEQQIQFTRPAPSGANGDPLPCDLFVPTAALLELGSDGVTPGVSGYYARSSLGGGLVMMTETHEPAQTTLSNGQPWWYDPEYPYGSAAGRVYNSPTPLDLSLIRQWHLQQFPGEQRVGVPARRSKQFKVLRQGIERQYNPTLSPYQTWLLPWPQPKPGYGNGGIWLYALWLDLALDLYRRGGLTPDYIHTLLNTTYKHQADNPTIINCGSDCGIVPNQSPIFACDDTLTPAAIVTLLNQWDTTTHPRNAQDLAALANIREQEARAVAAMKTRLGPHPAARKPAPRKPAPHAQARKPAPHAIQAKTPSPPPSLLLRLEHLLHRAELAVEPLARPAKALLVGLEGLNVVLGQAPPAPSSSAPSKS